MVAKVLVLALFVGLACAATWRGKLPIKPQEFADKEGCYVSEINDVIPFGETIAPIGNCYRISCGETEMHYASCGAVGTDDPKCYIVKEDTRKPYPDCCPDIKCDQDNNIS